MSDPKKLIEVSGASIRTSTDEQTGVTACTHRNLVTIAVPANDPRWPSAMRDRTYCLACETDFVPRDALCHLEAILNEVRDFETLRMSEEWPTPNHMRTTAKALDMLTCPARYGDVLRWVADACDESLAARAALQRGNA